MKRTERKHRLGLTLLFAAVIFVVLLFSVALSIPALIMLTKLGALELMADGRTEFSSTLLFMGGISLIIGFVFALATSRLSLRPVNNIITQMNRLAAGDFKARLEIGSPLNAHPTFAEITESFNTMAEELESTEMLRSDFINNFSHEFKTPIVSIAGFAKLLRRGKLTEQQREEYLSIIEEESLRLSELATNVLELTKVENQTILNDVTRFNLSEQLRSCVLLLEEKWSSKNLTLDLEFEEHLICANEELLRQVWINLLDNAIKFSPDTGEVQVRIKAAEDTLCVSITNYGSEIDENKQDKIWGKFYQGDESHASKGNGIGLAVVRRVTQLHGGSAAVKSGDGITTFTVELPREQLLSA